MQNEIAILKVNKFNTVALVSVTYRINGEVRVSSGKTEAEAMANINNAPVVKQAEYVYNKRSNSGRYFVNNNGFMVEE
jgi:hypothetical protein